jgi:hypothetical protein
VNAIYRNFSTPISRVSSGRTTVKRFARDGWKLEYPRVAPPRDSSDKPTFSSSRVKKHFWNKSEVDCTPLNKTQRKTMAGFILPDEATIPKTVGLWSRTGIEQTKMTAVILARCNGPLCNGTSRRRIYLKEWLKGGLVGCARCHHDALGRRRTFAPNPRVYAASVRRAALLDRLFDGAEHRVTASEVGSTNIKSFRDNLYTAAARRGLRLSLARIEHGEVLILQATQKVAA